MTNLTHFKKLTNPKYLGACDFPAHTDANGKTIYSEFKVQIKQVVQELVKNVDGKEEQCMVVYFEKASKPMICNKTNAKMIAKVTGSPFIENWTGKTITLGVAPVRAFGETVDAVRVKFTKP